MRKWHKITLAVTGVDASETAHEGEDGAFSPFTDIRLDVTFVHNNNTYEHVPGFYACDGNSAETGATSGNQWHVHFRPDHVGLWTYTARYIQGPPNVATMTRQELDAVLANATVSTVTTVSTGSFWIEDVASNTWLLDPRDLRLRGRLEYVGEHHLRFRDTSGYFLKAGADSPENFLAYEDFGTSIDFTCSFSFLCTWL